MQTDAWYRWFASEEATGSSPVYAELATAVAGDQQLLRLLDELPRLKRQPNLLFAAARFALGPVGDVAGFAELIRAEWPLVASTMMQRSTQTNEAARTATFLPLLAGLDGPIALIEAGCSAGLCLYPDRYSISYDRRPALVDSSVEIGVATHGPVPIPDRVPNVVVRIGIDRTPLDVSEPDDLAWLEACVWPEHEQRRARLHDAASIVAGDPPLMLTGDVVEEVDHALDLVPAGVTPVVFHSAVLNYLDPTDRGRFARRLLDRDDLVWMSNEAPGVVEGVTTSLRPPAGAPAASFFVVGLGGTRAVAISDPHGGWIMWSS